MKLSLKATFFLSFLLWANYGHTQTYTPSTAIEPFVFLEDPELADIDVSSNDWPVFALPIGFNFDYFDITSDTIYSAVNSFGGYTTLNQDESNLYILNHFYANYVQRGESQNTILSNIYCKTEGDAPNRKFTLEYNDMGFFFGLKDDFGIFLDYINIQVRLYETSGDIEFHIGPYSMQGDPEDVFDGFDGPIVGLLANIQNIMGGTSGEIILLEGDSENPTVSDAPLTFIDWPVPENTVFRFTRNTPSSVNTEANTFTSEVYPNPTKDVFNIDTNEDFEYFEVYDLDGNKLQESKIGSADISNLAAGIYLVKITFKDNVHFHRITKI